jgi:cytochrome c-type biogenesis protein CcmE
MKSLKKQRRIQIISILGGCLVVMLGLLYMLPDDAFQFFYSPTEVVENGPSERELIRLGGLVVDGSIRPDEGQKFFFAVTDGNAEVPVHYVGNDLPPDLFEEGQGTVATGHYVNGVFQATEILAKHDETYMPAEVIDALKEQGVYVDPDGGPITN